MLANGLVLFGIGVAGRAKMNNSSAHIANHAIFDEMSCVMRIMRHSLYITGTFDYYGDSGPAGMALCILVDGSTIIKTAGQAATTSVVLHTLDRFWKIVYPIHHRKHYRRWMLYVWLFLPWLNGFVCNMIPTIVATRIVDGICYPRTFWPKAYMEEVCLSQSFITICLNSLAL